MARKYDAFISYSQDPDKELASAIQIGLRKLGAKKHLLKLRALEIFRDLTDSSGNTSLKKKIETGLQNSNYIIVLCSVEAGKKGTEKSRNWVEEEVRYWFNSKSSKLTSEKSFNIILCITEGCIEWNYESNDFNWEITNCIPKILKNKFSEIPLWIDFRDLKKAQKNKQDLYTLDSPAFKQKIAEISSKIQDLTVDQIISKDYRSKRIWSYLMSFFILSLASLTVSLFFLKSLSDENAAIAIKERDSANQARLEEQHQRQIANQQRDSALIARKDAVHQREIATAQRDSAIIARREADLQKKEAEKQKDIARQQEQIALIERNNAISQSKRASSNALNSQALLSENTGSHIKAIRLSYKAYEEDSSNLESWKTINDLIYGKNLVHFDNELTSKPLSRIFFSGPPALSGAFISHDNKRLLAGFHSSSSYFKTAVIKDLENNSNKVVSLERTTEVGGTLMGINYPAHYGYLPKVWEQTVESNITYPENLYMQVSVSQDGKYFVASSGEPYAAIYDWEGEEYRRLEGHWDKVLYSTFSNDSKKVATASNDDNLIIHNVEDGSQIVLAGHNGNVIYCEFSEDDTKVLSLGTDKVAIIWDINDHKSPIKLNHDSYLTAVKFLNDSTIITAALNEKIKIWSTTGDLIREMDNASFIWNIDVSSNKEIFATSSHDGLVKIWDREGNKVAELDNDYSVGVVRFHPNPNYVFCGNENGSINLWNIDYTPNQNSNFLNSIQRTHKKEPLKLYTLGDHKGAVQSIEFSSDKELLISSSQDGSSRIWNLKSLKPKTFSGTNLPQLISTNKYSPFSNNEKFVLIPTQDSSLIMLDIEREIYEKIDAYPHLVSRVAFAPNDEHFLVDISNGTMDVYDAKEVTKKASLPMNGYFKPYFVNNSVYTAIEPQELVCYGLEGDIRKIRKTKTEYIRVSEYNSATNKILYGTKEGEIILEDLKTQSTKIITIDSTDSYDFKGATLSNNGRYLAFTTHASLYIWDLKLDEKIFQRQFHGRVIVGFEPSLAFAPSNNKLLYVSGNATPFILDINENTASRVNVTQLLGGGTNYGHFATNGLFFVTAGYYGMKFWSISNTLLFEINPYEEIHFAWISPKNAYVLAMSENNTYLFPIAPEIVAEKMNEMRFESLE